MIPYLCSQLTLLFPFHFTVKLYNSGIFFLLGFFSLSSFICFCFFWCALLFCAYYGFDKSTSTIAAQPIRIYILFHPPFLPYLIPIVILFVSCILDLLFLIYIILKYLTSLLQISHLTNKP